MNRFLLFFLALFAVIDINSKDVKISVTPSNAKIFIDGNYVGDGITTAHVKKSDGFIVVKLEAEGYITQEIKLYSKDKRKAVSYTLRRDALYDLTTESGNANKYFSVRVSKDLYAINSEGKIDSEKAWKLIHQIILNYLDEIQTTDIASGFVQTPWYYKRLPEIERVVRTRVTVREINLGGDLTFQIKVSSEIAPLLGAGNEEAYHETNRILKELAPLINEFQLRLGK